MILQSILDGWFVDKSAAAVSDDIANCQLPDASPTAPVLCWGGILTSSTPQVLASATHGWEQRD